MKYTLSALTLASILSACGNPTYRPVTRTVPGPTVEVPGPTVTIEVPAPVTQPTETELLVANENDYRTSVGQLPLSRGLTCSLYNLLNGAVPNPPQPQPQNYPTALPSATAMFTYKGSFNQEASNGQLGLQVLPNAIRLNYLRWYAIRCVGYVVILDSGYHNFSVNSDDASLLYINNALVVNNNGQHGMTERNGSKQLRAGVHSFRLDYLAGEGDMGLIVNFDGAVLPAELLYR